MRRLGDAMVGLSFPFHHFRVSTEMWADMEVWLAFIKEFNGVSFWREVKLLEAELQVQSDAAAAVGFEVYFRGRWCAECWPDSWLNSEVRGDLTFLELFSFMVGIHIWSKEFQNTTVRFGCDNQVVVFVVNRQTSKSPWVIRLLHAFVLQCLCINALFLVKHVPGLQNGIANTHSHFQEEHF